MNFQFYVINCANLVIKFRPVDSGGKLFTANHCANSIAALMFLPRPSATKLGRPYGVTSASSSLSSCRTPPPPRGPPARPRGSAKLARGVSQPGPAGGGGGFHITLSHDTVTWSRDGRWWSVLVQTVWILSFGSRWISVFSCLVRWCFSAVFTALFTSLPLKEARSSVRADHGSGLTRNLVYPPPPNRCGPLAINRLRNKVSPHRCVTSQRICHSPPQMYHSYPPNWCTSPQCTVPVKYLTFVAKSLVLFSLANFVLWQKVINECNSTSKESNPVCSCLKESLMFPRLTIDFFRWSDKAKFGVQCFIHRNCISVGRNGVNQEDLPKVSCLLHCSTFIARKPKTAPDLSAPSLCGAGHKRSSNSQTNVFLLPFHTYLWLQTSKRTL